MTNKCCPTCLYFAEVQEIECTSLTPSLSDWKHEMLIRYNICKNNLCMINKLLEKRHALCLNVSVLVDRLGQDVASLLRRLGLPYQGNESHGKIRINGISLRRWLQPKLASPFSGKPEELGFSLLRIGKGISHQRRNIRTGNLSLD